MAGQPPWWGTAAIGTANVILGLIAGFVLGLIKDKLEKKRSKRAFLVAIKYELAALHKQFEKSLVEITDSKIRLGKDVPPSFAVKFSTKVFDSQLSRLSSMSDPLILKVVSFYSTLDVLNDLAAGINKESDRMELATGAERAHVQSRVSSALMVTEDNLQIYQRMLSELLPQLPD